MTISIFQKLPPLVSAWRLDADVYPLRTATNLIYVLVKVNLIVFEPFDTKCFKGSNPSIRRYYVGGIAIAVCRR